MFSFFDKMNSFNDSTDINLLAVTLDFLSTFIANHITFLQQKKVSDVFDYLFFKKLKLSKKYETSFSKKKLGLLPLAFSNDIQKIMESLLVNDIFGKKEKSITEQLNLKEMIGKGSL